MSTTKIVLNRQSDLILDNAQITAPVGIVVADIAGLESTIQSIDTNVSEQISTEHAHHLSAEASLEGKISTDLSTANTSIDNALTAEASLRVAADEALAADLSTETANRIADVDAEESRAIVAETSLQNNIDAEASLRVVGDESLEAAMIAADEALAADLSTETARAESAEASLNTKVEFVISNTDPAALDSLTEIVTAFENADGDLNNAITSLATAATTALDNEASIRLAADQSIDANLSTEIVDRAAAVSMEEAARISGDMSVAADLSTEVYNREVAVSAEESARIAGDATLTADLSTEVVNRTNAVSTEESARISGDASLATDLTAEVSNRIADVDAEESRAMSAEASLTEYAENMVDAEISARLEADDSLHTQLIYSISTEESARIADVDAEESRAMSFELRLDTDIKNEVSRAQDAEASLADYTFEAVSIEASLRVAGDLSLELKMNDDIGYLGSQVETALTSVDAAISTETSARIADVDAEESRAMSAEAVLANDLIAEMSDRAAAIDNEASIRLAADQSLATTIANVISNADPAALDSLVEIVNAFEAADSDLNGAIQSLATGLSVEISTEHAHHLSAEASLAADLFAEISRADSCETSVADDLSTEGSRAMSVEAALSLEVADYVTELNGYIDVEESARISGDASLESRLTQEISDRVANVTTEASLRAAGDASLEAKISTDLSTANASMDNALSAEISRAEAAEASLAEELSYEVSYLIANTDLTGIDSFAEVSTTLAQEVARAQSAETNVVNSTNNALTSTYSDIYAYYEMAKLELVSPTQSPNGIVNEFRTAYSVEMVYLNGLLQKPSDYTISAYTETDDKGNVINVSAITFTDIPQAGDIIMIAGRNVLNNPFPTAPTVNA